MKKYPTVLKKYMSICHPPKNVEKIAIYLFHVEFFHIETEERLFDMDMNNFEGGGGDRFNIYSFLKISNDEQSNKH